MAQFAIAFIAKSTGARFGTVDVALVDPAGNAVLHGSQRFDFAGGHVRWVFKFLANFDREGEWSVTLTSENHQLTRLAFEVAVLTPP